MVRAFGHQRLRRLLTIDGQAVAVFRTLCSYLRGGNHGADIVGTGYLDMDPVGNRRRLGLLLRSRDT